MNDLLTRCSDIYDTLVSIYDTRKDIGYQDAVCEMVFTVDGTCKIKAYRARITDSDCMEIDWRIKNSGYDGYNMIINDNFNNWIRFIEDLTMAYYSSNGGADYNTYELMKAIGE